MASFVIDAQLPPQFAQNLRAMGYDAIHVVEIKLHAAPDLEIAAEAERRSAILVSKDEDFAELSTRGVVGCPILWIRIGNTTNNVLWRRMRLLMPDLIEAFNRGERIVEVSDRPRLVK